MEKLGTILESRNAGLGTIPDWLEN